MGASDDFSRRRTTPMEADELAKAIAGEPAANPTRRALGYGLVGLAVVLSLWVGMAIAFGATDNCLGGPNDGSVGVKAWSWPTLGWSCSYGNGRTDALGPGWWCALALVAIVGCFIGVAVLHHTTTRTTSGRA